jgi:hypothetical protein
MKITVAITSAELMDRGLVPSRPGMESEKI